MIMDGLRSTIITSYETINITLHSHRTFFNTDTEPTQYTRQQRDVNGSVVPGLKDQAVKSVSNLIPGISI